MATTDAKRWDVVVVGAGPVGLSLALGLARREHSVLVLEKEATTSEHSRAPAIWPGTQEILAGLGVIRSFLNEGIVVRKLQLWDADRRAVLLSLPLEELAGQTAYPHLLVLPQSRTERLLLEALQREPTAEVRFSCEATGCVQEIQHQDCHDRRSRYPQSLSGTVVRQAAAVAPS